LPDASFYSPKLPLARHLVFHELQMMRFATDIQHWLYGGASAEMKALSTGFDAAKLITATAIACAFGMIHALMPGHGKAVIVSYYLGRPAQVLGGVVTSAALVLTHVGCAVVLVLAGFIVIRNTIGGAGRAPVFEIASAAMIRRPVSGSC